MADRDEFENLIEMVAGTAYRVAWNLTKNSDDAVDLVQDATIQAYKGFDSFVKGTNFKAWFLKILTNRYLKLRARKSAELSSLDEVGDVFLYQQAKRSGLLGNPDDPARIVMDGLELNEVRAALNRLPEEFRLTAVMYFLNDFSYEQIADVLEVPVGTVRSRLHRGRKLLQRALWDVAVERGIVVGGANA
ncbi:MAG: sigma-70 family RNA polymerase sigma factor [Chthonomonadaceae bacterium]|nr:sigma-70 family RNA polymerase sigma factor [Chthonomonadaceae bacterium]